MILRETNREGVLLLDFEGPFHGPAVEAGEPLILEMARRPATILICNLSASEYISSPGLRVFFEAAELLAEGGGEFRICGLNGTIREIFTISGFDKLFQIFTDEESAVAAPVKRQEPI